jgi:hypothetical protein
MPVGLRWGIWMALLKCANGFRRVISLANNRVSIEKAEEPMDNTKNILTPFDAGFSFPKTETTDNRIAQIKFYVFN